MAPLDWDKAGEVVDPADFEDEEDSTAREVLDMAFSKMDPKKKQGYVEQLQKVQLAPEKRGPPIPQAREEELLAKGSKATQEEIEELLDLRRQRWGNAAGGRKGTGSCRACGTAAAQPFQCGTCKSVRYCSPECQKSHWKEHKKKCRQRLRVQICVLSDFA
ncbi:unnamed protein product [Durusdinium trenchii]|uniref:MYND-type domain-containing protein n=2 Tax=Durusdinium trenchii TaxID=1381693 RepID=A0ABP0SM88_9DINO